MKKILTRLFTPHPISNFFVAIIYTFIYDYVYSNHIATVWEYAVARQFYHFNNYDFLLYSLLSSLPFALYKGTHLFASAFSLFIYIFVYIPFTHSLFVYGFPESIKVTYLLFFFILMIVYFRTDNLTLFKNAIIHKKRALPFKVIPIITLFLFVVLIALNRSQLHFVNFFADSKSLYEFRESANIQLIYVLCWLRAAFLPLLMLYYLDKSDWIRYGITFIGFVLLFMLDQQKMTIVFPFAITAIYFAIKYYKSQFASRFHIFLVALFITIPIIIIKQEDNPLSMVFSLIFIYRIQCIAGMQFQRYVDFFELQDNPYTYFSHIGVVNKLTGLYPYNDPIGIAINSDGSNSNATFFLMDGVAAAGIVGCFIIGVVFLLVKSLLNSFSYVYNVPLLIALFLFPLQSLMNVSLFTALFSHGIIVLFFILLFVDIKEFKRN